MKPVVWLAGVFLLLTFIFPNGVSLPPRPVNPPVPAVPAAEKDSQLVKILVNATGQERSRIVGVYSALIDIISRDAGKLIRTTEQWSALQARALQLAVDGTALKGKYEGLDVAIEAVFENKLGAEKEVVPADPDVRAKIINACSVIVASAR